MAKMNVSDERLREVLAYANKYSDNEASDRFGIKDIPRYRRLASSRGLDVPSRTEETKEMSGQAISIDDFIAEKNIDLDVWEIVSAEIKDGEWDVSSKERNQDLEWTIETDEKGKKYQLMEGFAKRGEWETKKNRKFSVRVVLRKKKVVFNQEQFKLDLIESIGVKSPYAKKREYKNVGEHCLEINIFDLHLGKLAWEPETGDNYDHKIAQERFFDSIEHFITMSKMFKVNRILFPFGNDFFNSDVDYPYPQTTAGTPQENDLRWQKSFKTGREMIIMAVNRLKEIAPVVLLGIPGNHDFQKTFYLGDVLDVRYENDENVIVNNSPTTRKYYKYGQNLIGFTHGRASDIPEARLLLLMPQEAPQLWADTKYREWHCGDIHHKKKTQVKSEEDHQGINIRYMRTLKGTDSWEAHKGWIGSIGGAEAFIWNEERGLVANFNYNL
jgi:hypothetical protein